MKQQSIVRKDRHSGTGTGRTQRRWLFAWLLIPIGSATLGCQGFGLRGPDGIATIRAEDDWSIPSEGPVTFGSKKSPYILRRLSDAEKKTAATPTDAATASPSSNAQAKAPASGTAETKQPSPPSTNSVAAKPPTENGAAPQTASAQQDVQDTGVNELDIDGALEGLPAPYRDLLKRQMLAVQKHTSENKGDEQTASKGVKVSLSDTVPSPPANVASAEAKINKTDETPTLATAALASDSSSTNAAVQTASGTSTPIAPTPLAPAPAPSPTSPAPSVAKSPDIKSVTPPAPSPSVADETKPAESPSVANTPSALTTWNQSLGQTIELLKKQIDDESSTDENLRYHREISLRMLYVAARKLDEALEPISGLSDQENSFLRHEMQAMYEASNPDAMPVRSRHLSLVMNSQRLATNYLASVSNLEVRSVAFCTEVERYGVITKFPKNQFSPDQEVLLYCEIENVAAKEVRDGFETQLQGSYEIVDSTGKRIAEQILPMEPDICQNHRRDYFIVYKIYMPQQISPGQYKLRLTVEDMNARKFGQSTLDFQIKK